MTAYARYEERRSPAWCEAFAAGAGGNCAPADELRAGPAAFWGHPKLWDLVLQARADGRTWYYGDHGYFGRGRHFRVTRDAFQATGLEGRDGAEQLKRLEVEIKPWRRGGRHILVCPPGDIFSGLMARAGLLSDIQALNWAAWARAEIAAHTDRPILVRTKSELTSRPLSADLEDAWAVVTFMSNAALEGALAGVPVFVLGPAAAAAVGCADLAEIETPLYAENRFEVASSLAASQWTLEEIREGKCWRTIQ